MACYPSRYLDRISTEVEILLTKNHKAIDRFKKQIEVFNQEWLRYCKALKQEPTLFHPNPLCWEVADKLPCYYATLAVVFDYRKMATSKIILTEGILDSKALKIMLDLLADPLGPTLTEDHLKTALRWVKADLAGGEPAETEQKAALAKCRRVTPILCATSAVVIFLAALLTILHYMGWLDQKDKTKNPDKGSQSARTTAILSAVAELEQIANNFEIWAERERDRFRRGVNPSDTEKWMKDWLSDSYIASLFDYPVARQTNGLFPNGSKKEFRLIIDTFQLYMPTIAASLMDTYNSFLQSIKFHIQHYELEKQKKDPILSFWCDNFLDTTVAPTVKRLRHIAKMTREELKNEVKPKSWIIGWLFARTSNFIYAIVVAVIATIIAAIIVGIFADFAWIQRIKAFIYRIVLHK